MLLTSLAVVSALSFAYYGGGALFTRPARGQYERYGVPTLRLVAGSAQVLGAVGLMVGLVVAPVGMAAAAGLTLMMLLAVAARWHLRDALRLMVPAGFLATINAVLVYLFLVR